MYLAASGAGGHSRSLVFRPSTLLAGYNRFKNNRIMYFVKHLPRIIEKSKCVLCTRRLPLLRVGSVCLGFRIGPVPVVVLVGQATECVGERLTRSSSIAAHIQWNRKNLKDNNRAS